MRACSWSWISPDGGVDERARAVDDLHRLVRASCRARRPVRRPAPLRPSGLLPDRQPSSPISRPRFSVSTSCGSVAAHEHDRPLVAEALAVALGRLVRVRPSARRACRRRARLAAAARAPRAAAASTAHDASTRPRPARRRPDDPFQSREPRRSSPPAAFTCGYCVVSPLKLYGACCLQAAPRAAARRCVRERVQRCRSSSSCGTSACDRSAVDRIGGGTTVGTGQRRGAGGTVGGVVGDRRDRARPQWRSRRPAARCGACRSGRAACTALGRLVPSARG